MVADFLTKAQRLAEQVTRAFLVERDPDKVLSYFSPDITWFGTGEHEVCENTADAVRLVREDIRSHPGAFQVFDMSHIPSKLTNDTCCIMTRCKVASDKKEGLIFLMNLRITWIVKRGSDRSLSVTHLHMSVPNADQAPGEYYPQTAGKNNFALLERRLREKTAEINNFYNILSGGVCKIAFNEECTLLYANDYFFEMFGYTRRELEANHNRTIDYICVEDLPGVIQKTQKFLLTEKRFSLQYRIRHKTAGYVWVKMNAILSDEVYQDNVPILYCVYVDITELICSYEQIELEKERYRIVTELAEGITFDYDLETDTIEFANKYEQYFDIPAVIPNFKTYMRRDFFASEHDQANFRTLYNFISRGEVCAEAELCLKTRADAYVWFSVLVYALYNGEGRAVKTIGMLRNIDRQKQIYQELEYKSQIDPMTKLYNKSSAERLIKSYLLSLAPNTYAALFIVDIDDFKSINDSMGHFTGDYVIQFIVGQMINVFRRSDILGRFGGDEFIILMKDIYTESVVREKAEALRRSVAGAFSDDAEGFSTSLSIGVAMTGGNAALSWQQLFQRADKALYHAKSKGKNRFALYSDIVKPDCVAFNALRKHKTPVEFYAQGKSYPMIVDTILDFLLDAENAGDLVPRALSFLGNSLNLCQSYAGIFEQNQLRVASHWASAADKKMPRTIPVNQDAFLLNFNSDGVFACDNTVGLRGAAKIVCESLDVGAILLCLIFKNKHILGLIGFNVCKKTRAWTQNEISILRTVSKILTKSIIFLENETAPKPPSSTKQQN